MRARTLAVLMAVVTALRALVGVVLMASLLAGCTSRPSALDSSPQPDPAPSASMSAAPEPAEAAAGQPRIPAECDELVGAAGDELGLAPQRAEEERYWGAWWVSRLQAGLALCYFDSAAGDQLAVTASLYSDPDFLDELQGSEVQQLDGIQFSTACPELEPGVPYYCTARMITGPYFLETFMYDGSGGGDASLIARHDVVVAGVVDAAASLGDPLAAATAVPSEREWPADCGVLDFSSSSSAATFSSLSEPAYAAFIAPEDLRIGLLNAEPDRIVLACDWSPVTGSEFSELRVEILTGGSWALADPAAIPDGRAVTIPGVDQARILEHPRLRHTVVAGAVGPDLVLAHVFESDAAPDPADRESAAIAFLADLVASEDGSS